LGALASGAFAAAVSIKGNVNETADASNNYFMSKSPTGATAKSLTGLNLDFLAQTPTTRYLLDTNYSYYKYFGPGAADTSLTWGTPASARFSVDHIDKLTKYNLAASWNRADAVATQLAQSGVATLRGTIDTYNVSGNVTRDLSRIDTVSLSAQGATVSYSDPTQTPYVDFTTTAAWNHTLSQTTTLTNSVNFDWFDEDNPAKSQRLLWKLTSGLDTRLSARLTVNGHVGVAFVNSYQNGVAPLTPTPLALPGPAPFQPQVGAGNGVFADVGLNYDLLKSTTVSLTAAQALVPLLTGQIQKTDTVEMSLNYKINYFSNLSFSTQFSYLPPSSSAGALSSNQSSPSDFFSASVNYGYQLAREWRTNVSYTYRQRNDDTGLVRSSAVLFTLSRDFTLLGNPAAINQAEAERARQRAQNSVGYVFPGLR
jgi:hypothetical protein